MIGACQHTQHAPVNFSFGPHQRPPDNHQPAHLRQLAQVGRVADDDQVLIVSITCRRWSSQPTALSQACGRMALPMLTVPRHVRQLVVAGAQHGLEVGEGSGVDKRDAVLPLRRCIPRPVEDGAAEALKGEQIFGLCPHSIPPACHWPCELALQSDGEARKIRESAPNTLSASFLECSAGGGESKWQTHPATTIAWDRGVTDLVPCTRERRKSTDRDLRSLARTSPCAGCAGAVRSRSPGKGPPRQHVSRRPDPARSSSAGHHRAALSSDGSGR